MEKHNRTAFIAIIITMLCVIIGLVYTNYQYIKPQNKVFGVTYMTMNNPFYEVINNEILKTVEGYGDRLITLDPALDVDKQIQQIEYFIEKKVDGIFVNPIDSTKIEDVLSKAKQLQIPVFLIDVPIVQDELVDCTIVSDNYDAGVKCAKDMMKHHSEANIILLKHSEVQSAKDRIDGFLDTIKGHTEYKIINEGECEGQLELAMPLMEKMLKETNNVDVVMALNDPSALGALAALESQGMNDVKVYGIDGTPDLKSLINQSDMIAGTVAQSPISIGQIASTKMYQLLSGESVEEKIVIPVTFIDRNNIASYDEKGWQ